MDPTEKGIMPPEQNLYEDGPTGPPESAGAGTAGQPAPPEPEADEAGPGEYATSILPKSLFPGKDLKPGDTVTLKVESVHENEVEVCEAKPKEAEAPAPAPAPAGEMSSLME